MHDLDIIDDIKTVDKANMMDVLMNFADQYKVGIEQSKEFKIPESYCKVKNIIISGMGGSAIGGDLLRTLFSDECPIPIMVNRDYGIPAFVDESTLFIAASYSGNTEETLSALNKALEKKAQIIIMAGGGKLQRKSEELKLPFYEITKKGLQPRCAFGYMFPPLVSILHKLGFIKDQLQGFNEAIGIISNSALVFAPEVPTKVNLAKQLAHALWGKLPIIYAPNKNFDVVAMRWKGQINENSKAMAFYNVIPEMNHNEIVGWGIPLDIAGKRIIIILTHKDMPERIKIRINVTGNLISNTDGQVIKVEAVGKSLLAKALYLIYLGDFASYYLAILNNVDPTPIDRISILKEILDK